MSVVLDINPLLVEIASQALQGKTVKLHEFPLAPLNDAAFSKLQQCRAPAPLKNRENYHFVLADGTNLPFASDSFDTVITPWFVDIVPMDLKDLVPMINRNLATGGTWINSGSLAFFHGHAAWCYSEEEVLEIVAENGFDIVSTERRTVPYLHSPLSAHGRMENVLSFAARKVADTEVKDDYSYLPEWILDTSTAVPASDETAVSSSDHLLRAQVLAALDGKRSINDIGKLVARQYALGKSESVHAVRCIVLDAWEERNGAAAELDS
jgi:hypothetical protein